MNNKIDIKKIKYILSACIGVMLIGLFYFKSNNVNIFFTNFSASTTRNVLDFLYLLSSPLLLVVAFYGLKQISLAKEKIMIDAKRESHKISAEQCEKYLNEIIPLQDKLDVYLLANNIQKFGSTELRFEGKNVLIENKVDAGLFENDELMVMAIKVLNQMESFSVFFVAQVANEKIAYKSIGNTFIGATEQLLPLICTANGAGFNSIFQLYIIWKQRLEKESAYKTKILAESKLNENCVFDISNIGYD